MSTEQIDAPLAGVRVLDLSRLTPGAYATMLLADLGADVVKIEQPVSGDYLRTLVPAGFSYLCRNKRSVAIDMKSSEGRAAFLKLVESADVVLESFRPGVCSRLGIGYEHLSAINPAIVFCSLSGFGQTGPYRTKSGHDLNYLGVAGALSLMGDPSGAPAHSVGIAVADFNASMFTAMSIVSAVLAKVRTGKGQHIDVSMTDCMASWMGRYVAERVSDPSRTREAMMSRPGYDVYQCSDDTFLTLGCVEDVFWQNLLKTLPDDHALRAFGTPESRDENLEAVEDLLAELFRSASRDHWLDTLEAADVPVAPVHIFEEILDDPQLQARGLFIDNPDQPGAPYQRFPVGFSAMATPSPVRAPELGEHTDELLREAGFSNDETDALRRSAAI